MAAIAAMAGVIFIAGLAAVPRDGRFHLVPGYLLLAVAYCGPRGRDRGDDT